MASDRRSDAIVRYYASGQIKREVYYIYDRIHRTDGPAEIYYYESGKIIEEIYCFVGMDITTFVKEMRASTNKTETLAKILNTECEHKNVLAKALPIMFRNEIDPKVFDNLTMFF